MTEMRDHPQKSNSDSQPEIEMREREREKRIVPYR